MRKLTIKKPIVVTEPNKNGWVLKIYQHIYGLRGWVLDSNDDVIMTADFYEKDGDATVYRVKEYFNF